jgi:hypothetical protein
VKSKKKVVTKPKQVRTRQKALEHFLELLTSLYPMDKLAPGIVISFLDNGQWYGSVYQYPDTQFLAPNSPGRIRLHHFKADSFNEMVDGIIAPWYKSLSLLAK